MTTTEDPQYNALFGVGGNGGGGDVPPGSDAADEGWDFDPSEAVEFARLVPGTYHADIVEPPTRQFSKNSNAMLVVKFHVTDEAFYGATPVRRFMLGGKGAGWTKTFLRNIGLEEEAEGTKKLRASNIVGRRCLIVCRWQKNQDGTVSDEWTEITDTKPDPRGPRIDGDDLPPTPLDTGV